MMTDTGRNDNSEGVPAMPVAFKYCWWALLLACGAYFRWYGLDSFTYSGDETMHLNIARGTSLDEVLRYARYEVHPPLFYILLHYWMGISTDPFFVRLFPQLTGMVLIPVYYCIGKRIGGEWTGMVCATLIAFSHSCISQSQVLRQYDIFLLTLSLSFYHYLGWRKNHRNSQLTGYVIFGCLAALSHFSAIFCFFCITVFETICLFHRQGNFKTLLLWAAANLLIADVALAVYDAWQPALMRWNFVFSYYFSNDASSWQSALQTALRESIYIYPSLPITIIFAVFLLCVFFVHARLKPILPWLGLLAIASLLSAGLYFTQAYADNGTRHNLWLLPFIVPVMGTMLAQLLTLKVLPKGFRYRAVIVLMLLAFGVERTIHFSEEYSDWQRGPWQQMQKALAPMGPRDLLVTGNSGINQMVNYYQYLSDESFMRGEKPPRIVPYHETNLLISPHYYTLYSIETLKRTLRQAQKLNLFDNVDRIVFVKFWGLGEQFYGLMRCDIATKKILYPPLAEHTILTDNNLPPNNLAAMSISKEVFLKDVLPESGKSHGCFR